MNADQIPQIVAFARATSAGRIRLKKPILERLGAADQIRITTDTAGEVLLTSDRRGVAVVLERGHTLVPPGALGRADGSLFCFLERPNGLALKKMETHVEEGRRPEIIDRETATTVMRTLKRFPEPDTLLELAKAETETLLSRARLEEFWSDKLTLEGHLARRLLGTELAGDGELGRNLMRDRLDAQHPDGSWGHSTILTSRAIEDLLDLGMARTESALQAAGRWLLSRPQSPHNPGMFFLSDELVGEQVALIERRMNQTKGPKGRFRNRPRSETRAVEAYDLLFIDNVCGPRIMWPNGIALHALLRMGFENHERIQALMHTLCTNEWCECGYQHGFTGLPRKLAMSDTELAVYEAARIWQFRAGGVDRIDDLTDEYRVTRDLLRIRRKKGAAYDEYAVRLPTHIQSCEYMTTYGASASTDARLRRFAEAHLWRFAALAYSGCSGNLEGKGHLSLQERHFSEVAFFLLKIFSEYHHPAAELGVYLAIPWLAATQNGDGSWGDGDMAQSATLGVVRALRSIGYIGSEE